MSYQPKELGLPYLSGFVCVYVPAAPSSTTTDTINTFWFVVKLDTIGRICCCVLKRTKISKKWPDFAQFLSSHNGACGTVGRGVAFDTWGPMFESISNVYTDHSLFLTCHRLGQIDWSVLQTSHCQVESSDIKQLMPRVGPVP